MDDTSDPARTLYATKVTQYCRLFWRIGHLRPRDVLIRYFRSDVDIRYNYERKQPSIKVICGHICLEILLTSDQYAISCLRSVTGTDPDAFACEFFQPLKLFGWEWYVGLFDLTTYNSILIVIEREKRLQRREGAGWMSVMLLTSVYKIDDITAYLEKKFFKFNAILMLRFDIKTLKCQLKSTVNVKFAKSEYNIGRHLRSTKK